MMSIWRYNLRASAAQMLVHIFDGEGLSTPIDNVDKLDVTIYQLWRAADPNNDSDVQPLPLPVLTKTPPTDEALSKATSQKGPQKVSRDPRLRQQPLRRQSINDVNVSTLEGATQSVESNQSCSGSLYVPSEITRSGNTDSTSRTVCADQTTVHVQKTTAIRRHTYP
ncbi:hypothetical protein F5Y18DRAFT_413435 [Xylariaceae sp. FL1019]|nr:hypothetical protein F5Y18DRAFT_413435 [Xylariaceae sp. FL1019]